MIRLSVLFAVLLLSPTASADEVDGGGPAEAPSEAPAEEPSADVPEAAPATEPPPTTLAPAGAEAPPPPPVTRSSVHADALATYSARRLQRGIFFGSVETWGTGLLFWHGSGAGPLRRKRLLEAFGTVEAIRTAAPADVAEAGRYKGPEGYRMGRVAFLQEAISRPARGGVVVPSSWNVLDGYGAPLSPRTLALRVGAFDVLERIDREAEAMLAMNVGVGLGSAILVSLGGIFLRQASSTDNYPTRPPPALASQAAERSRGGTALVFGGTALATAAASATITTGVLHTKLVTFWTEDDLDQVIHQYNSGLQAELGLTRDDVGRYLRRRSVVPRVLPTPAGVVGEF
jgi:hypothetical protein